MSTLVLWAGVDTHGVSSAYIATDSRLSDPGDSTVIWDAGQKAYCSSSAPLLAGYVGSTAATHILPRLITYGEAILPEITDCESFVVHLARYAENALSSVSSRYETKSEIVLAFRLSDGTFGFGLLNAKPSGVGYQTLDQPGQSAILHLSGSGAEFVRHKFGEWRKAHASDTSRAIYSAFCDALLHVNPPSQEPVRGKSKDPQSEGPPQLVGIYRKPGTPGKTFGTIWKGKLYFSGIEAPLWPPGCECRNDLFERCDPITKRRILQTKRHIDEVSQANRQPKKRAT